MSSPFRAWGDGTTQREEWKETRSSQRRIRQIKVPLLIVYDPADNIQGKGGLTKRETIVAEIKGNAVDSPRVDVLVIPSIPGSSPFQAHFFVKNERVVTQKTVDWLKSVGLSPALPVN
ncbi:MAG TPA: hypothetical protein VGK99_01230 [Acidobacteriota bacterium]